MHRPRSRTVTSSIAGSGGLSPDQRTILVLRHYAGMTVPEIADALGHRRGHRESRLHHAIEALRAALDADARRRHRKEVSA